MIIFNKIYLKRHSGYVKLKTNILYEAYCLYNYIKKIITTLSCLVKQHFIVGMLEIIVLIYFMDSFIKYRLLLLDQIKIGLGFLI